MCAPIENHGLSQIAALHEARAAMAAEERARGASMPSVERPSRVPKFASRGGGDADAAS